MKNSQTLAAERLQAFEKLDKAEEQKRRLDRFEEDIDYLYDRGLSALRELNYLPLTAKDSQDFMILWVWLSTVTDCWIWISRMVRIGWIRKEKS